VLKQLAERDNKLREKVLRVRNLLHKDFEVSTAYEGFSGDSLVLGVNFDSGR
jgi:hypothetical protein